jgi:Fe2+ or Zn2+ uptake regulation protein
MKLTADASSAPPLALGGGHRLTPQRREVYDVILEKKDHPTATEIFLRAKDRMPHISLATVYNCLETLTQAGLVRQVHLDRAPSRYCPNLQEHAHFHCTTCGGVEDVFYGGVDPAQGWQLPPGASVNHFEIAIKGQCAHCAAPKTTTP